MKRGASLLGILMLLGILLPFSPAMAGAPEGQGLFMNLTSSEAWRAGMALKFSDNMARMGYAVTVFLNVEAVTIAARNIPQPSNGVTGRDLQTMLKDVMAHGGKVIVCPMCMRQAGLTAQDLIEGVKVGAPDYTVPALMAPGTKVMSY